MRRAWLAFPFVVFLLMQGQACASVPDPGVPQYANNVLSDFVTPTVAPGDALVFAFNVSNPYDDPDCAIVNLSLEVGIYRYATQEEVRDVDDEFDRPPVFDDGSTETTIEFEELTLDSTESVSLTIRTDKDTPHGSYFLQSTYFVRFRMTFQFEGNDTLVALQSRGYFTDEQWDEMVSFDPDKSIVNLTYMHELGVDGIIPDSSFGLKIPIPRWPLALLVVACVGTAFMATYYFVLDNPGRYPKLEKRFYQLRGKLGELRGKLEHVLRKR
ncbi:TPA: hypothetical protein HA259_05400 [Thermoplasmata archaeon]|nr:hypothetical protein [Thermoplasmata archaeon]